MGFRERGSHARDVYLTQDTSFMETASVQEEVGADTKVILYNNNNSYSSTLAAFFISHVRGTI